MRSSATDLEDRRSERWPAESCRRLLCNAGARRPHGEKGKRGRAKTRRTRTRHQVRDIGRERTRPRQLRQIHRVQWGQPCTWWTGELPNPDNPDNFGRWKPPTARAGVGALRVAGGVRVVAGGVRAVASGVRAVAAVSTGRGERNGARAAHEHAAQDGADDGRVTHWQPLHDFLTTPATAVFAGRSVSGPLSHICTDRKYRICRIGTAPQRHHKCRPTSGR